jgi:hypothetical protein
MYSCETRIARIHCYIVYAYQASIRRVLMHGSADKGTSMISVSWIKRGSDGYCDLELLDLRSITATTGVYAIWHEGNPARVVRIGQENIATRLGAHRQDSAILAYKKYGRLRVTTVPAHQLDGVERYLANAWPPLVGDAFPAVAPLAVNSPFAA